MGSGNKMKNPIEITEKAIEMVQQIMGKKGIPENYCLRVGVKGGAGCFGVNYVIGFDKSDENHDMIYDISGVKLIIAKRQLMFVMGVTLDYIIDGEKAGFTFYKEETTA